MNSAPVLWWGFVGFLFLMGVAICIDPPRSANPDPDMSDYMPIAMVLWCVMIGVWSWVVWP